MKATIYARTAVRKQSAHDEGIQSQIEVCMKYANENGYQVTNICTDIGYSGMKLDRPGLDKIRELIARQSIDAVVVSDVARLTRSANDNACLEREFVDRGVRLYCVASNMRIMTAQAIRVHASRARKRT
ncbi:MAG: recombinase family protein [Chloroflexi bacterium]|nr:recombinase family protein [Chloroflexota bacterium]